MTSGLLNLKNSSISPTAPVISLVSSSTVVFHLFLSYLSPQWMLVDLYLMLSLGIKTLIILVLIIYVMLLLLLLHH